jgi:hypothetical protein
MIKVAVGPCGSIQFHSAAGDVIQLNQCLNEWREIPGGGWEFFSSTSSPDRLWVPPSLLSNWYRGLFPGG